MEVRWVSGERTVSLQEMAGRRRVPVRPEKANDQVDVPCHSDVGDSPVDLDRAAGCDRGKRTAPRDWA
jgi:hypothetical protein